MTPPETTIDDCRKLALDVIKRIEGAAVVAITTVVDGKPALVVATNEQSRAVGAKAGALIKASATVLGGGGGGKDDIAQGGGTDPGAIAQALAAIEQIVAGLL